MTNTQGDGHTRYNWRMKKGKKQTKKVKVKEPSLKASWPGYDPVIAMPKWIGASLGERRFGDLRCEAAGELILDCPTRSRFNCFSIAQSEQERVIYWRGRHL